MLHSTCQQIWKTQQWYWIGKGQFSFQSQRKATPNVHTTTQLHSFHMLASQPVQSLSCVQLIATPWNAACQASLSITNSRSSPRLCPSSQWCHPAISSSVVPFSSCPQSFPASGSFQMSEFSASGGQSIGISALASVLTVNTHDWSPLGCTGWISLQSKGLSRGFSNTTVQKHQFSRAQLSL